MNSTNSASAYLATPIGSLKAMMSQQNRLYRLDLTRIIESTIRHPLEAEFLGRSDTGRVLIRCEVSGMNFDPEFLGTEGDDEACLEALFGPGTDHDMPAWTLTQALHLFAITDGNDGHARARVSFKPSGAH